MDCVWAAGWWGMSKEDDEAVGELWGRRCGLLSLLMMLRIEGTSIGISGVGILSILICRIWVDEADHGEDG